MKEPDHSLESSIKVQYLTATCEVGYVRNNTVVQNGFISLRAFHKGRFYRKDLSPTQFVKLLKWLEQQ